MCNKHEGNLVTFIAFLGALILLPSPARAQYPDHPIKFWVAFSPGGIVDNIARLYANRMSASLRVPIIVENRPGGGGKLAEEAASRAPADGYTILIDWVTRPTLARVATPDDNDIEIEKAFDPIGPVGITAMVMDASPTLGVSSFNALVDKIRSEPGKYSYGSQGVGSPGHIVSEQLAKLFGLDVVHVPYLGGTGSLNDVMAGRVAWSVDTPSTAVAFAEAKKIIPLFVTGSARIKQLPAVPTLKELGHSDMNDETITVYMLVPKGSDNDVKIKLNQALMEAQADAEIQNRLESLVISPPQPTDLAAARRSVEREVGTWRRVVNQLIDR